MIKRRKLLKQIGASSTVALGAAGFASANDSKEISLTEANCIRVEVDGEMRDFTIEEFQQHPDTGTLEETASCCYECLECCQACCNSGCCWGKECGSCPGC